MPIKRLLILSTTISIISCSPALVNIPNCPEQEVQQCASYPDIDMPPIPKVIHCTIEPGMTQADDGCEQLIRNYAATRKVIKQWQGSR